MRTGNTIFVKSIDYKFKVTLVRSQTFRVLFYTLIVPTFPTSSAQQAYAVANVPNEPWAIPDPSIRFVEAKIIFDKTY